ncbi:hypothetical protein GCM10007981_06580 [Thermocladium modestius]|uniref:Uncharacterized protein n=1 Tax=Thermocladium modestius TaxID=62609 RepID=A0A830GUW6_9CREN|nr:hypothetical protein [Thermocladium modestius]GGP20054.1 hypothetical protein GCM10007981_06580 [Thermocladium modestius]
MYNVFIEEQSAESTRYKLTSEIDGKMIELSVVESIPGIRLRLASLRPINENEFAILAPAMGRIGFYADYVKESGIMMLQPSLELRGMVMKDLDDVMPLLETIRELVSEVNYMINNPKSLLELKGELLGNGWLVGDDSSLHKLYQALDGVIDVDIRIKPDMYSSSIADVVLSAMSRRGSLECLAGSFAVHGFTKAEDFGHFIRLEGRLHTLGVLPIIASKVDEWMNQAISACHQQE